MIFGNEFEKESWEIKTSAQHAENLKLFFSIGSRTLANDLVIKVFYNFDFLFSEVENIH